MGPLGHNDPHAGGLLNKGNHGTLDSDIFDDRFYSAAFAAYVAIAVEKAIDCLQRHLTDSLASHLWRLY